MLIVTRYSNIKREVVESFEVFQGACELHRVIVSLLCELNMCWGAERGLLRPTLGFRSRKDPGD